MLTSELTFGCGVTIGSRIAMAPMIAQAADPVTHHVTDEDVRYFARRSRVGGVLITGAAYVQPDGCGFDQQISIASDDDIAGLSRLASAMKQDGAAAIVQLYHGGREAMPYARAAGSAFGPSAMDFPWLPWDVKELTDAEIRGIIRSFGAAARRAIAAGFDGVEVHGANHYLLQQFFSAFSNRRDDEWGGDLERRMAFPLAVLDEVQRVVAAEADRPFVVGYRFCPEEVHGDVVGYTIDESLQLIDRVAARGVDYVHLSMFVDLAVGPQGSDRSFSQLTRDTVAGRCAVMAAWGVTTEAEADAAMEQTDIVAIGRTALLEPEFGAKIAEGRGGEIETTVSGRLYDLDLPAGLIEWYTTTGIGLLPPLPGLAEYIPTEQRAAA